MPKFTYNDIVTALPQAPSEARPGEKAWVIGVYTSGYPIEFGSGTVYLVEFEGGDAVQIHESNLILVERIPGVSNGGLEPDE